MIPHRAWLIPVAAVLVLLTVCTRARAELWVKNTTQQFALQGQADSGALKSQPSYTCDQVRAFVAEHGKVRALALAIEQGATLAQIRAAKRCLR